MVPLNKSHFFYKNIKGNHIWFPLMVRGYLLVFLQQHWRLACAFYQLSAHFFSFRWKVLYSSSWKPKRDGKFNQTRKTDGRFTLNGVHIGVRPDRGYLIPHDNHQVEMVAIKAGDNGEVYLKFLLDGKRSKWLHPKGKAKKYVGLRSNRQWKWKLTPSNND